MKLLNKIIVLSLFLIKSYNVMSAQPAAAAPKAAGSILSSALDLKSDNYKLLKKSLNVSSHKGPSTFYTSKTNQELEKIITLSEFVSTNLKSLEAFKKEFGKTVPELKKLLSDNINNIKQVLKERNLVQKKLDKQKSESENPTAVSTVEFKLLKDALSTAIHKGPSFFADITTKSEGYVKHIIKISNLVLSDQNMLNLLKQELKMTKKELINLINKNINDFQEVLKIQSS